MKLMKYNWKNKKRTLLRHIKVGDIFFFENAPGEYYFGRIMSKNLLGHVAEIFENPAKKPDADLISSTNRKSDPVILDSYSLFDRCTEGCWKIIAHQEDYAPPLDEPMRWVYGAGPTRRKIDIFDNEEIITESESKKFPHYSPSGDVDVKKKIGLFIDQQA